MTGKQENKLSMYSATKKVVEDNEPLWQAIAAMVNAKNAFAAKIAAIRGAAQKQGEPITGIATDKGVQKELLIDLALPVCGAIRAYASLTGNNQLFDQVKVTRTELQKTRDEYLGPRCQNFHDLANANLAALADYGITAPVLSVFQDEITDFIDISPSTTTARAGKKSITTSIPTLFKEADNILINQLDSLMLQFDKPETEMFYSTYRNARNIIQLGATTAKVRGTVKKDDGTILAGVTFTIRNNATAQIIGTTNSNQKGHYGISQVPVGNYDFIWTFPNFKTVTEFNIHVSAGQEVRRNVTMNPLKTENFVFPQNSIFVLGENVQNNPNASVRVKNISPLGVTIHIYFGGTTNEPFSGTGVTLQSGDERVITLADLGTMMPYILAQNASATTNATLRVTILDEGI